MLLGIKGPKETWNLKFNASCMCLDSRKADRVALVEVLDRVIVWIDLETSTFIEMIRQND